MGESLTAVTARADKVLLTATSYPPAIGGAQTYAHRLACEVKSGSAYDYRVVAHWSENRTDWLLGTTVNAPPSMPSRVVDGIPVHYLSPSPGERLRLLPWVAGYYAMMGRSIDRISECFSRHLEEAAGDVSLVHNVRIGRENLSYASLKLARRHGVPFVFVPLHHPRWVGWRYRAYLDLYREADALLALTESERDTYAALGVDPKRVWVTGMGPMLADDGDGERFRVRHRLGEYPVVLFLGQKYGYKGFEAMLEGAAAVWSGPAGAEVRFVFIGPRTRGSRRAFAGAVDRRILELGPVDLQEKTDALAACSLLCVPSSQESFGGVYTEAWMMGKPVIGGPAPAIAEIVSDADDGFVVEQSAEAIAGRIGRLLADPDAARSMGERGRAKVLARYTWPHIAARLTACYDALLGG